MTSAELENLVRPGQLKREPPVVMLPFGERRLAAKGKGAVTGGDVVIYEEMARPSTMLGMTLLIHVKQPVLFRQHSVSATESSFARRSDLNPRTSPGGRVGVTKHSPESPLPVELVLEGPGFALAVQWKAVGDAANVGSAVRQLKEAERAWRRRGRKAGAAVPIVAVPFMGETGRRLCAEAGVSWVDLSGNAWIDAPGRQIRFIGHKNRFRSAGPPDDRDHLRPATLRADVAGRPRPGVLPVPGDGRDDRRRARQAG